MQTSEHCIMYSQESVEDLGAGNVPELAGFKADLFYR